MQFFFCYFRYCFVEMAHDKGLLSSPEYGVMCQWYEYIENNVDITLDLIGKLNFHLIHKEKIVCVCFISL